MDRDALSQIAHTRHRIAAPVAAAQVRELLSWLSPPTGGRVLDLGCGWGAWLLELLDLRQDVTAVGVDLALPAAVGTGAREGIADRVTWVQADAAAYSADPVDAVLCIGASHAFGGLSPTLDGVRRHLRPGGQVLLGDAIWERPPSTAAQEALDADADEFPDLAGVVAQVRAHGFEPSYGHVSTLQEWDDYEWSWTGSLVRWALREAPTPAEREAALTAAREHRDGWLNGYRGQLGFVTVVLDDVS